MTRQLVDLGYNHTERQAAAAASVSVAAARSHWIALWCSKISPRPTLKCQPKCQNIKTAAAADARCGHLFTGGISVFYLQFSSTFCFAPQPYTRLGVVSSHPHFNPIELGQLNSSQIGQLDLLFHTYTYLVSRVGTLQNTDWLVSNIIFAPKVCKVRSDKLQLPAGALWERKWLSHQVKLFRSLNFFIFALCFCEPQEINAQ